MGLETRGVRVEQGGYQACLDMAVSIYFLRTRLPMLEKNIWQEEVGVDGHWLVVVREQRPTFIGLGTNVPRLIVGTFPILGRRCVSCGIVVLLNMSVLPMSVQLLHTV